jgi:hypothetical protein
VLVVEAFLYDRGPDLNIAVPGGYFCFISTVVLSTVIYTVFPTLVCPRGPLFLARTRRFVSFYTYYPDH